LRGWNAGNKFAHQAMRSTPDYSKPLCLPEKRLYECWLWNLRRNDLQAKLGTGAFVPMIMFFEMNGEARTMCVWGDAIPIALPKVDSVFLVRKELIANKLWP